MAHPPVVGVILQLQAAEVVKLLVLLPETEGAAVFVLLFVVFRQLLQLVLLIQHLKVAFIILFYLLPLQRSTKYTYTEWRI